MRCFHVYIMASAGKVLYVGVTNNLERRIAEHKAGLGSDFTSHYRAHRLVYCEEFSNPRDAIAREKQLKGWRREKKIALIEAINPDWRDLSVESG